MPNSQWDVSSSILGWMTNGAYWSLRVAKRHSNYVSLVGEQVFRDISFDADYPRHMRMDITTIEGTLVCLLD